MNIDWYKWVENLLPPLMRRICMQEYAYFFISPVRVLYKDFAEWRERAKIKAAGTPQVCMIEKIVKDAIGIDIIISEGNGYPTDFIIHANFLDIDKERQLFALIDRYKLAGKRYEYKNTALTIESNWDEYVCEQQTAFITWGGYLCEEKYRPIYYIRLHFDGQHVYVNLEKYGIASDMKVRIYRYDYDPESGGAINWYEVTFDFKKGDYGKYAQDFPYNFHMMTNVVLSKKEDEEYIYKYDVI